jgi:hypothetical protein
MRESEACLVVIVVIGVGLMFNTVLVSLIVNICVVAVYAIALGQIVGKLIEPPSVLPIVHAFFVDFVVVGFA